jgi:hypothetical protein
MASLFYMEYRNRGPGKAATKQASALEIAAEEFLNGLLCHYEPPQTPRDNLESEGYFDDDQLVLRRPPSILKTSRSFENRKQKSKKGRSVRFYGINLKPGTGKQGAPRPGFLKKLACRKEKLASF